MISATSSLSVAAPPDQLSCEGDRLNCIRDLNFADEGPLEGGDTLVECVANHFRVPIAFFSVVDASHQRFKASIGLDVAHTTRKHAFCQRTIQQRAVFLVPDASKDRAFSDNPLVLGPPHIRFYAGAPVLIDRRHAIGSLCIVDRRPRAIDDGQIRMLRHFALMLSGLIEIQHIARETRPLLQSRTQPND